MEHLTQTSSDSGPRDFRVLCQREMMAFEMARYLADELDIEATVQEATRFASPESEEVTTFQVSASCTLEQMQEAARFALFECIEFDRGLIDAGVLPEWETGRNIIPSRVFE